jgi:hypothetical protein
VTGDDLDHPWPHLLFSGSPNSTSVSLNLNVIRQLR